MTEEEWNDAQRPFKLIRHLERDPAPSERKLRLFCVATCKRVAEYIANPVYADTLECLEVVAEVEPDIHSIERAERKVLAAIAIGDRALEAQDPDGSQLHEFALALNHVYGWTVYPTDCAEACMSALCGHDDFDTGRGELMFQTDLLRDIFGNPFRPVTFSEEWRTSTAVALARQMYDSRDFGAMPILADALQDAGCEDDAILSHCRDAKQTHVRGCWVCDLVLNKK
jgi:hypothetical protein